MFCSSRHMKIVRCFDCGKKFKIEEAVNISIPKLRCEGCLKKLK